jgi:outer membrane protein
MKNLKKSAELSRKNTTLLARDYKRGLARNIDVQLALTEFRISQRSFDQAHFAAQLDMYQLRAAIGRLPDTDKPEPKE